MKYIFISYINRSGSTFLINQFSKPDQFCVCPEADILYDRLLLKPFNKSIFTGKTLVHFNTDRKLLQWKLDPYELENILQSNVLNYVKFFSILQLFRQTHFPDRSYIVFKFNHIYKFGRKLPVNDQQHIYWISLIRNPVDTYISQKTTISPFNGKPFCTNPYHFCKMFASFYKHSLTQILFHSTTVRFEPLVKNTTDIMNILYQFLGFHLNHAEIISRKGRIMSFFDETYRKIHLNIDESPNLQRINKSSEELTNYEKFVLRKYLPVEYSSEKIRNFRNPWYYIYSLRDMIRYFSLQLKNYLKMHILPPIGL